jgi:hypothetical protein
MMSDALRPGSFSSTSSQELSPEPDASSSSSSLPAFFALQAGGRWGGYSARAGWVVGGAAHAPLLGALARARARARVRATRAIAVVPRRIVFILLVVVVLVLAELALLVFRVAHLLGQRGILLY